VSVDTVRFYERRGLVAATGRSAAGYREFAIDAAERVADVKVLQTLGLTLDDVGVVFADAGPDPVQCHHLDGTLAAVIDRLDERMAELAKVREQAIAAQRSCRDGSCTASSNLTPDGACVSSTQSC